MSDSPIVIVGALSDPHAAAVFEGVRARGCEPVVLPDYPTTLKGRTLRSATAIFRDSSGHPFASLCVNTDVTGLDAAMNFLRQFQPTGAAPAVSEPADMELLMSEIIQASLQRSGQGRMNKQAKVEAVRVMQERGLFKADYAEGPLRQKLFGGNGRLSASHPAAQFRR